VNRNEIPEGLRRRLADASAVEPPQDLLDAAMRQVRQTPQMRRAALLPISFGVVGVATGAVVLAVALGRGPSVGPGTSPAATTTPSLATASRTAQPLEGTTLFAARDVVSVSWSPDGSRLVAIENPENYPSIIHVFTADGHEVWTHPGLGAAWTGTDTLAFLEVDPKQPDHGRLSVVTLTSGALVALEGSYLNSILASSTGRLAVATGATTVTGFALQNPAGRSQVGVPLAWDAAGSTLAVGQLTQPDGGPMGPVLLSLVDASSGEVEQTGIRISRYGVAFDHSGRKILACVFAGDATHCRPSLINITSKTAIMSTIDEELLNAGELSDGRWVGWNPTLEAIIWDPMHPTDTVTVGSARSAVSSEGRVALVDALDATHPPVAPSAAGLPILHLAGPTSSFPIWSPQGDRVAYLVTVGGQVEVRVADAPAS
jgi:hypothetical protein